jgi:hypothetical protein
MIKDRKAYLKNYRKFNADKMKQQMKDRYKRKREEILREKKEYHKNHRSEILIKMKDRREKNIDKYKMSQRNSTYKKLYGITADEFDAKIKAQSNLCPIGLHHFDPPGQSQFAPCMDHDHVTGELRGVICRHHNRAIGFFKDNTAELQSAIAYLNLWGKS